MNEQILSGIETNEDTPCSREDFVRAMKMLNSSASNVSADIDIILSREGDDNLKRILWIALNIAKKHDIALWTPETSEKILASLEKSKFLLTQWIAQNVRRKIDGIIWAAPADKLLAAINTIQKGNKRSDKLSIDLILLLGQIKLQDNRMTDLAKYSGTCTAAITGTADRLVELWYVVREHDTGDRRVIFLRLTEKGRDFLHKIETELTK